MTLAYARNGLCGVLVPQANTTVEPELAVLMPAGTSCLAARMMSARTSVDDRLVEYFETIPAIIAQFANAPLGALGFATTGSSYLVGVEREDAMAARMLGQTGMPFWTAALAICAMLRRLGAKRIGIVSPYPEPLTDLAVSYWAARGFEVVAQVSVSAETSAFHPIYALISDQAARALTRLHEDRHGAEALVLLGTGLPTLHALAARGDDHPAALSSTQALGWAMATSLPGLEDDDPADWISGARWRDRLVTQHPL